MFGKASHKMGRQQWKYLQEINMDIIGASGHSKVIIDILHVHGVDVTGLWDDNERLESFFGFHIDGDIAACIEKHPEEVIIAIGHNEIRKAVADRFRGAKFGKAIHPSAFCSSFATIGAGTVIMAHCSVNAGAQIGRHVIVNTNASIDHECIIGDFVHVSPQAGLAGNVDIGEGTHIGLGANIIQGIKIGTWCTIGAGAVIIRDVPDGATVVGNPGRIIKQKRRD